MMRLKTFLFGSILTILTISCSQPTSVKEAPVSPLAQSDNSVVVETEAVEADVADEEPAEPDEPAIETSALAMSQFDFFSQPITGDAREDSMVNALARIIKQFNTEGFVTINMTYKYDDPITGGIAKTEGTWYYNAERQICASSKTFHSDRTTEDSHYLFRDNDLVAMTYDTDFYDEGAGYTNSVRIASTQCPRCGVSITNDDENGYEVSEIDQSSLYTYANDFFSNHEDMLKTFKEVTELTKQGERYAAFVTINSNTGMDTIMYSIDPNLVHRFFKKAVIRD